MDDLTQFTGTEVNYYFICKKKLWWFRRGVTMEHNSDQVKLGKQVHENAYSRQKKEISIDDKIVLDWRESGVIHEVKLSDKMEEAHEFQLLYYLFYLKAKGVTDLRGQIDYPKLRHTKVVQLTTEHEAKLIGVLTEMLMIAAQKNAPDVEFMKICNSCSYAELCWS